MKKAIALGLLVASMGSLTGCVVAIGDDDYRTHHQSDWETQQENNRTVISRLEIGASYNEVLNKLGTPEFSERLVKDGQEYQILFFQTHHNKSDGRISKDECTPLLFKQKQLVGWGEKALLLL